MTTRRADQLSDAEHSALVAAWLREVAISERVNAHLRQRGQIPEPPDGNAIAGLVFGLLIEIATAGVILGIVWLIGQLIR